MIFTEQTGLRTSPSGSAGFSYCPGGRSDLERRNTPIAQEGSQQTKCPPIKCCPLCVRPTRTWSCAHRGHSPTSWRSLALSASENRVVDPLLAFSPRVDECCPLRTVGMKKPRIPTERIVLAGEQPVNNDGRFVLYWMIAARRLRFNFALDHALDWARALKSPFGSY